MRHVSDGELHAYLDGALDQTGEDRGKEVREHLATCPVCQERLQDEEAVRAEADRLLDSAVPTPATLPSFEELRARAETAEAQGDTHGPPEEVSQRWLGRIQGRSMAWAATVVLALGVGWMGGEVWRGRGSEPRPEYLPIETMAESASDVAEEIGSPPSSKASVEPEPPGRRSSSAEAAAERSEAESPAGSRTPGVVGGLEPSAGRGAGPAAALLDTPDLSPPPSAAGSMTGEMMVENSLAVPGLEVLSVDWEEWVPGERGLHIRQLLPMGDTLELRYLGMLIGADVEAGSQNLEKGLGLDRTQPEHPPLPKVLEVSLPPGWNQVVMKKARGWLVARAPLSEASLKALLLSLR